MIFATCYNEVLNNKLPCRTTLCTKHKALACRPSVQPNTAHRFSTGVRLLLSADAAQQTKTTNAHIL